MISCLVAKKEIAASACIEEQRSNRCFCVKGGVPALQAAAPEFEPAEGDSNEILAKKRRTREELVVLRGRCDGMLRKPPNQRYAGPALTVMNGGPKPSLIAGELPAAPKAIEKARGLPAAVWSMAGALEGVARRSAPSDLAAREDEHEAAIASQELDEDRPGRKEEPRSLVGGAHVGRMSGDTSESAATGVRRQPSGDSRRATDTSGAAAMPSGRTGADPEDVAPARQVPNVPIDDRRPQAGVGSDVPKRTWSEFRKEKDVERAAAAEDEPPPPPAICDTPGCRTKLRVNNLSGKCQRCRNKVAGRDRKFLIPKIARAAGNARNVLTDEERAAPERMKKKRGPKPGAVVSSSMGKRCSVPGCARVLANKTKGDKCAPCLKGVKPGSGWEPCANAPACPRMAQRWKGELCALCRQGKKYHLVEKLKEKAMPEDKTPRTCAWPEEKCTVKILRLRASNKKGYCPKHNALVRQREARNINCASPRKKRGGLPKPAVADLGVNPPELEQPFPGMPAFADVPIAWARQFHDYLCKQGITFVTLSEDAAA